MNGLARVISPGREQGMYDTLIIGRDLSSLVAALTCVCEGRKTIWITEENPDCVYREAGYTFPSDARPLWVLADWQLFSTLIRGLLPADYAVDQDGILKPAFQIILPGHRVDLFSDREKLIGDLVREFPEQEKEIKRFYRTAEKAGNLFKELMTKEETGHLGGIERILSRIACFPAALSSHISLTLPKEERWDGFHRILQAQLNFLSHLETDGCSLPLFAAYLLSIPMSGFFHPPGGMNAWKEHLRRAFMDHGGILKQGCSIIRIETEPNITVDLKCEESTLTLSGRKLIVSAQWEKLELLLPARKVLSGPRCRNASIRSVGYPFCLHMGVHEGGLPELMAADCVVLRNGNGPMTRRDLVFLHLSPVGDTDYAPQGCRALSATIYLADSPLRLSDQELKKEAMGIIDLLETFLPFLRESIDYLRVDQSILHSRKDQEILSRKYHTPKRLFFGMRTFSPHTRLRNVLLTGSILRAGLGFEGEILAGMNAAFQSRQRS